MLYVGGKIYSYILNKRLTQQIEDNKMLNEAQTGFRQGYSTIDHVFTLLALVQKQLLNHGNIYFIDFKKTFDLIDRNTLWLILKKTSIRGKMYKAVKSMYDVVKARVRVGGDLTGAFMCSRGLKQGDSCSPILFPLLIKELANETALKGKHGITLSPDILQILIMLFADDVVLLSNTIAGLHCWLNVLRDTAKKLHLVVNFEKSQVVIFRNGGYIAAREKRFNDDMKLKIVNHYKYLGIIFSTGLTFSYAPKDMSVRARKGVLGILILL